MGIGTVEQAQQAKQELASKNTKIIYQLPRELLIAGKSIRIFNVTPQKWEVAMGGMGSRTIPECKPGEKYSEPLEIPFIVSEGLPIDMEHIEFRMTAGSTFAESVIGVGPHRHPSEDLRRFGVFIAAGDVPTKDELAKANKSFSDRDMELIRQADGYYGDGPGEYKNITKQHRDALDRCEERGMDIEERPWHKPLKTSMECPACHGKIPPGSVKCNQPSCGAIIDWPRAYEFGLVPTPERPNHKAAKKGGQAEA